MATQKVYIGSVGPFLYDDAAPIDDPDGDMAGENCKAIATPDQLYVGTAPSDPDHVLRLDDVTTITAAIKEAVWPIGSIYIRADSANPAVVLGFGTWNRIAEGQFIVGQLTGDPDFGSVTATGGNKNHTHDVDVPSTGSTWADVTEQVDNNLDSSTVYVGKDTHTHNVDPAPVTSGNPSALPPFCVLYVWRRIA